MPLFLIERKDLIGRRVRIKRGGEREGKNGEGSARCPFAADISDLITDHWATLS